MHLIDLKKKNVPNKSLEGYFHLVLLSMWEVQRVRRETEWMASEQKKFKTEADKIRFL